MCSACGSAARASSPASASWSRRGSSSRPSSCNGPTRASSGEMPELSRGVGDLVFLGPPGVGKGTQAKALVTQNGWVHLSTGDLFREHIRRRTDLGERVQGYLDAGEYVPDDLTVSMVRERVRAIPRDTRIVFDGFPRTVAQ